MQRTCTVTQAKQTGKLTEREFYFEGHTPHWETVGQSASGRAYMRVRAAPPPQSAHEGGCWLSLDTTEHGDKASKRTMLTIQGDMQIRALRALCNIALGED